MKKLLTALFAFVLLVLGTPALIATIMYDGSGDAHMPVHLYTEDADAQQMLLQELNDSLDDLETGATDDMIYNLHEDIINVAIFQAIRENNPEYMPTDDCATPEECYIAAEQANFEDFNIMMRAVGAWVDFSQDKFNLNVFLEVELEDGFTYKTIISTEFKFTDVPGKYVLEFEQLKIGNLPLPASALSAVLNTVENNVDEVDFDDVTQEVPVGELDLTEFSYTITKQEIVEQIGEDDDSPETDLVKEVLSIIFEQELLTFELVDEEFVVSGRLSKFQNDTNNFPEYLYDLHSVDPVSGEVGEFDPNALDPETYLTDLFTEYVFNYALVGDAFEINEETFNKLIYSGAGGFAEQRFVESFELTDGNVKEVELGLQGMWFEITPDAIYANALMKVDSLETQLVIRADKVVAESSATELVFEFTEITFGADAGETANDYLQILDLDVFKAMFAEIGDIEFGEFDANGTLIISADRLSNLMQDGSAEDTVIVTGINIIQDAIAIAIEPADDDLAKALDDFSTALESVVESQELLTDLEGVLDTTTEGPEQDVYNAVQDLQETLQADEPIESEQIEELFEGFEELDSETQEEFLETIEGLIDPTILAEYEGYFEGGN